MGHREQIITLMADGPTDFIAVVQIAELGVSFTPRNPPLEVERASMSDEEVAKIVGVVLP